MFTDDIELLAGLIEDYVFDWQNLLSGHDAFDIAIGFPLGWDQLAHDR